MSKNKNQSIMVAGIVLIALVVIAFGIISFSKNSKNNEDAELKAKCLDIEMHALKLSPVMNPGIGAGAQLGYNVTVSRSEKGQTIDGVEITLSDVYGDIKSQVIEGKIAPSEQITYTLDNVTITPVKVTMAPYFLTKSGSKFYCEKTFSDELTLTE